jgi:hypothetical protein
MNCNQTRAGPVVLVLMLLATAPANGTPKRWDVWLEDEQGRKLRVDFDPANRFYVDTGFAVDTDTSSVTSSSGFVGTGWTVRHGCDANDTDCWKSWHRFLEARVYPGVLDGAGRTPVDTRLFRGRYVAFLEHPYIVRPGTGGKLPVPFNFGFTVDAGGFAIPNHTQNPGYEVNVIDAKLLLDFWRTPSLKTAVQLGVGVRYDIWLAQQEDKVSPEHQLAPFTAASLFVHHESRSGRHLWHMGVDAIPFWSNLRGWNTTASASARYQWVFLAVNDQPVSLYADASFRHATDHVDFESPHSNFRLMAGVQGSLNLN